MPTAATGPVEEKRYGGGNLLQGMNNGTGGAWIRYRHVLMLVFDRSFVYSWITPSGKGGQVGQSVGGLLLRVVEDICGPGKKIGKYALLTARLGLALNRNRKGKVPTGAHVPFAPSIKRRKRAKNMIALKMQVSVRDSRFVFLNAGTRVRNGKDEHRMMVAG